MGKPARTPPIPLNRLIALWKISLPVSIERELLSEISRMQGVVQQARDLVEIIDRGWNEEVGSHFAAIHSIKVLLDEEPAVVARILRPRI